MRRGWILFLAGCTEVGLGTDSASSKGTVFPCAPGGLTSGTFDRSGGDVAFSFEVTNPRKHRDITCGYDIQVDGVAVSATGAIDVPRRSTGKAEVALDMGLLPDGLVAVEACTVPTAGIVLKNRITQCATSTLEIVGAIDTGEPGDTGVPNDTGQPTDTADSGGGDSGSGSGGGSGDGDSGGGSGGGDSGGGDSGGGDSGGGGVGPGGSYALPSDRSIDWSSAGARTDFSARTTVCKTLSPSGGDDSSAIEAAIAACPANQVVALSAGTYKIGSPIVWGDNSDVTLRGAGKGETILEGTSSFSGNSFFDFYSGRSPSPDYDWERKSERTLTASSISKGSTSLQTSSAHGWSVGDYVLVDELNDASADPPDQSYDCTWCSRDGGERLRGQVVRVESVPDSTHAEVSPALYFDYDTSRSAVAVEADGVLEGISIESLTVDNHDSDAARIVNVYNVFDSAFLDLDLDGIPSGEQSRHFHLYNALWLTIEGCDIHGGEGDDTNQGYGIFLGYVTSGILIENNVFHGITLATAFEGTTTGNVLAYNYTTGSIWYDDSANRLMMINHGGGSMNLLEGNYIEGRFREDSYFATGHYQTVFRNRIEQMDGKSDQLSTYDLEMGHHYNNAIGNVLGTTGYETTYECEDDSCSGSKKTIYRLGYSSPWSTSGADDGVLDTMLRHRNWDSVSGSVKDCDASGEPGCQGGTSDPDLPDSLYRTAAPDWWCSEATWPPIDTDSGSPVVDDIPAKLRYEGKTCTGS